MSKGVKELIRLNNKQKAQHLIDYIYKYRTLNLYVVNDNRCVQKNTDGTSIQIKNVRGN